MKKLLLLPLLLAACAPAVQTNPAIMASRTYDATCPEVLDALTAVAIRTQPSVAIGGNTWPPLSLEWRKDDEKNSGAVYSSRNSTGQTVTVIASCFSTASLTLGTSGQRSPYAEALNTALLDGIKLP